MAIKVEHCPSCKTEDIKKLKGNKFYCPECDATFKIEGEQQKVADTNPLGKEKARIDQLEDDVAELKGQREPGPKPAKPTTGGDDDKNKDEDEEEPDGIGFITW